MSTMDTKAVEDALRQSGAELTPGLSDRELDQLADRWDLCLAPDHRLMLSIALPSGHDGRWPDWRAGDSGDLEKRLVWPVEGIAFDVEHNGFWHPAWATRPVNLAEALAMARSELAGVPRLAPLYAHRYVPTQPPEAGNPILSCYQTDIIYYGRDLLDWFDHEFHGTAGQSVRPVERRLPFWSSFIEPHL
jgi:hypothetical protein